MTELKRVRIDIIHKNELYYAHIKKKEGEFEIKISLKRDNLPPKELRKFFQEKGDYWTSAEKAIKEIESY